MKVVNERSIFVPNLKQKGTCSSKDTVVTYFASTANIFAGLGFLDFDLIDSSFWFKQI
jgi:hypothetical protein